MKRTISRAEVPAFLAELPDDKARDCATRVLMAVGLLPLPRRTIRRKAHGSDSSPPEILRDRSFPACVVTADVEVEEDQLRASSIYGEASCRLGASFAHPIGSFSCTGSGIGH